MRFLWELYQLCRFAQRLREKKKVYSLLSEKRAGLEGHQTSSSDNSVVSVASVLSWSQRNWNTAWTDRQQCQRGSNQFLHWIGLNDSKPETPTDRDSLGFTLPWPQSLSPPFEIFSKDTVRTTLVSAVMAFRPEAAASLSCSLRYNKPAHKWKLKTFQSIEAEVIGKF